MKTSQFLLISLLCGVTVVLSGCPCGEAADVTLTPLSGRYGYYFEGPFGLAGTITKDSLDATEWVLEGSFTFPSSGYTTLAPSVAVMESYPEQVLVKFFVFSPPDGAITLPVLTEVPVNATISASNEAIFTLQVAPMCLLAP